MPTIENRGTRIHYEVHGSGHPIVLIHGGTVSFQHNFADFGWIESLNDFGLQVIGLDLRGHGKSDKPHEIESYGTANLASDVVAVLDHDLDGAQLGVGRRPVGVGRAVQLLFLFTLAAGVLVLSAALTATRDERMREAAVLRALGPQGTLVNVSRGSVVDEAALIAAVLAVIVPDRWFANRMQNVLWAVPVAAMLICTFLMRTFFR